MDVPQAVKNTLWSYDVSKMDEQEDKELIVFNVLNYGTEDAVKWLYQNYSEADMKKVLKATPVSSWFKKSLNYWALILGVYPERKTRFT